MNNPKNKLLQKSIRCKCITDLLKYISLFISHIFCPYKRTYTEVNSLSISNGFDMV